MPLARKLRTPKKKKKKKRNRLLLFCAFQAGLIIIMASFNRIWHFRELVFINWSSPEKCSSLHSIISSMRFLDVHRSLQKKEIKLHETAGNEKINQEYSSYFLLSLWASSLKRVRDSTFFFFFYNYKGKSKKSLITGTTNNRTEIKC